MHTVPNMNESPTVLTGERHLGDVIDAIRAQAVRLVLLSVAAAVVAAGLSSLLPRQYLARSLVMVSISKLPTTGEASRTSADIFSQTIATLLRSQTIAEGVLRDLKVTGVSAQQFASAIQVQPVTGTLLLRVSLDNRDAGTAVRLLDTQIARVVAVNRAIGTADLSDTREYLRTQVSDATSTLTAQERRLTEARATLQVESLKKRLESALAQRATLAAQRDKFAQEAAEFGAQAKAYAAALARQPKTVTLNRSLAEDTSALPDAAAARGVTRDQLLGLQLRSEVINPLYEKGEPALAQAQADEQGATAALASVKAQLTALDAEVVQLQQQLADRGRTQQAAERDFELAKSTYEGFAKSYENARLSVAAQNADVRVVEPASALATPVSPRPLLNGVAAGLAVLLLGVFTILVYTYIREDRRPVAYQ